MNTELSKKEFVHPCLSCGACCATFRVSFSKQELYNQTKVPIDAVEDVGGGQMAMKGTNKKYSPSCLCLDGRIGQKVSCQIYENRPSPCRKFEASYEHGFKNYKCDEARAKHGLSPLTKKDMENSATYQLFRNQLFDRLTRDNRQKDCDYLGSYK